MTIFELTPDQRVKPQSIGQTGVTCPSRKLGNEEGLTPSESYGLNLEENSCPKEIEML